MLNSGENRISTQLVFKSNNAGQGVIHNFEYIPIRDTSV